MKTRSLETVIKEASTTFKRFPFAIICSIAGSICMLILVGTDYSNRGNERILINLIITFSLGMVASVGTDLFSQRYYVRNSTQIIFNFLILALMIVYYKTLPDMFNYQAVSRTFILSLAAHLGVSFSAFVVNDEPHGFWQFNKSLFLRFLTATLYSTVLFIGIALALLAIDNLFKVSVPDLFYIKLWILIAGVFNTWFFLAGIPTDVAALNTDPVYPKGLKIFTQYVLVPLITIYLFILYAYTIRIIITQDWPVGWVSYLVIAFSVAGILALLLVWPLRDDESHTWIKSYARNFYFALFPLIILLFVAIGKRLDQYGITENRYFIIVIAIWLLVVALYFLISKRKRIKMIPISLFITVLLAAFGPWSAFSVSRNSQLNHLSNLFEKNGWIDNEKVKPTKTKIDFDDQRQISSTMDYLINTHGVESVQPLFSKNLESLCKKDSVTLYINYTTCILESVGLNYLSSYDIDPNKTTLSKTFSFSTREAESLQLSGYDYLINYSFNHSYDDLNKPVNQALFLNEKDSIYFVVSADRRNLRVIMSDSSTIEFNISELINRLGTKDFQQYDVNPVNLTLLSENNSYKLKFLITSMGGEIFGVDKNNDLSYFQGKVLVGIK